MVRRMLSDRRADLIESRKSRALTILSRCREADVAPPEWVRMLLFGPRKGRGTTRAA